MRQGEPCADLWTVESGLFTSRVVDPEGRSFLMDILGTGDPFPVPGDRLLHFDLVEELGRGAFARVFLAKQQSLANRLSPRSGSIE